MLLQELPEDGRSPEYDFMTKPPGPCIPVARLLRPQGRRGELLAEPLSDLPDLFTAGRCFWAEGSGRAQAASWTLEAAWEPTGRNAGRIVLKLAGVDSISAAETIAGHDLLLAESDLPARDEDTFLVRDLLGCTLLNGDTPVGEIVDVQFATGPDGRTRLEDAAPLLAVRLATSVQDGPENSAPEPLLVPFVKAWMEEVDLANRTIRMNLPEGLLDR